MRQLDKVEEAIAFLKSAPAKVLEDPAVKKLIDELGQDYRDDHYLPQGGSRPDLHIA